MGLFRGNRAYLIRKSLVKNNYSETLIDSANSKNIIKLVIVTRVLLDMDIVIADVKKTDVESTMKNVHKFFRLRESLLNSARL